MYVIVYKFLDDRFAVIVAKNKTLAMNYLDELHGQSMARVWRAMDDTGWCAGSPDAYEEISHVPSNSPYLHYIFR